MAVISSDDNPGYCFDFGQQFLHLAMVHHQNEYVDLNMHTIRLLNKTNMAVILLTFSKMCLLQ